jgi:hypothetical protein
MNKRHQRDDRDDRNQTFIIKADPPPRITATEVAFACAFLPIVYGSCRPDDGVDTDNISRAIRLGKLAAKMIDERP